MITTTYIDLDFSASLTIIRNADLSTTVLLLHAHVDVRTQFVMWPIDHDAIARPSHKVLHGAGETLEKAKIDVAALSEDSRTQLIEVGRFASQNPCLQSLGFVSVN